MGIRDWLFRKKQEEDAMREFAGMMEEYDSSPLPEGKLNSSTGDTTCPHCGYVFSLTEGLRGRAPGAVGATDCSKCSKTFKQH